MEYPRLHDLLPVLVLDGRFPHGQGWLHVPDVQRHQPDLLYHDWPGELMFYVRGSYRAHFPVQAVAAMSPNTEIAALLFSFLFSFVITLCV